LLKHLRERPGLPGFCNNVKEKKCELEPCLNDTEGTPGYFMPLLLIIKFAFSFAMPISAIAPLLKFEKSFSIP
jgi:hypothetical protein